ncbi:NAD(P)/FAD-dependent oxidoreductase [Streptomyces radiopugnans]|uniref:3-phenylpropionate/trans-cinnamate dioxygenase ferredoxin reductase subunit n=1 Tax=Streptomyces radiopugnans TaxID=403935 RepID=A0A1H9CVT1_9ACTN|nr:FAD-dependent oxidoreductase [Streptomyces radiopugnans]SEQ05249.1 3-phenylpropionate/trans-cinnamate dioxygenase ferredoxin reductase subunit [Streptomyces radiopugnans]
MAGSPAPPAPPVSSVVIVGAGQAGADTAAALRGRGFSGRITLVGEEEALPYRRPPLSKGYLGGTVDAGDLELLPASSYADQGIDLVLGDRAARIDPEERSVVLDSGTRLSYDRLVLATGARPRRLPVPGADLDGVMTLRGLADAAALREALRGTLREGGHLLVVGGGFVGLELAATARGMGLEATVVEVGPRLMARALSPGMSEHLRAEHLRQGVRVLLRREVAALRGDASGHVRVAELDGGERVQADLVVFGVGVRPGAELAAAAGLEVGDGILVDRWLRTSDPAIHAIGDCARFPSARYGRQLRLESVQNASDQARCAAAAICGDPAPYEAVPWFWTEQYATRLQIAGITDGHDRAVTVGDPSGGRFSVLCFRGERLLGAESAGRPADHMIVRRLLAAGGAGLSPGEAARPGFDLKEYQGRSRQPA